MKKFFPELPIPEHYDPNKVGQVWRVPYQERANQARQWATKHSISDAHEDNFKIVLVVVDVQNTFCIPDFELFVAGRSGMGAVEDNRRLCDFIYRNLGRITQISATLDTHQAMQIFHPGFVVDEEGNHPAPYTLISHEDIKNGRWQFNKAIASSLGIDPDYGYRYLEHYTSELAESKKFDLTIWPYHAMVGGIGHAFVSAIEEAIFFHSIARYSQPKLNVKGRNPLTEHYSALGPEVVEGPDGEQIGEHNDLFLDQLKTHDALILAGQAKSHCVAWTISDLLDDIRETDPGFAKKVYLLEDCTSPVVVPGADYTESANEAFTRFAQAGMRIVRTTDPLETWPGIRA